MSGALVTAAVNPTTATVDFERDGVQHGHLKLPHSSDDSAWGAIMIPVTVVKNGEGPPALLTGANHGDEYEGPIALLELASALRPEDVTGRVIVVPMMNYPAFRAGRRNSPIDGGNLNRSFPGVPNGGVTQKIADYFQRALLPLADVVLDIHSGGRTLEFLPFAAAHRLDDGEQEARCLAAMDAFNAPYGVIMLELDTAGTYDTAAESMGKTFVTTELGGGGSATASTVAIARRGVRNLLIHSGILAGEVEQGPSRHLDMPDESCFVVFENAGLLEMCVDLGTLVARGMELARVYPIEGSGRPPVVYRAARDGILLGRRFPALASPGDTLAVIGVDID